MWVAGPYPATPGASMASSSFFTEDTSETAPAGGSAITTPSAAKNVVKCGVTVVRSSVRRVGVGARVYTRARRGVRAPAQRWHRWKTAVRA